MAHHVAKLTFGWFQLHTKLDRSHELVRLASKIDWDGIYEALQGYYKPKGRRHLPIRLMVGLHLLKHRYDLSDRKTVDFLRENFYWMYFCDVSPDWLVGQGKRVLERSSMSRFRGRIGDKGVGLIEEVIRKQLMEEGLIDTKVMTTDSTAMEKHIVYPTDSSLLDRGRRKLVQVGQSLIQQGIRPMKQLRTYAKKGRQAILGIIKLGKDRKERIQKNTLALAQYAQHVLTQTRKMIAEGEKKFRRGKERLDWMAKEQLRGTIQEGRRLLKQVKQVIYQSRERFKGHHVPKKLYSYHEPQVTVIRKGKRSKPDEYGCKVNLSFDPHGFVVGHQEYTTNRNDAKLLEPALKDWEKGTGNLPKQLNVDRGYRQKSTRRTQRFKKIPKICMPPLGQESCPDKHKAWHRRGRSLRAGSEASIGHLKQDHRMNKSRYTGFRGDKINVGWAILAWNTKKWVTLS